MTQILVVFKVTWLLPDQPPGVWTHSAALLRLRFDPWQTWIRSSVHWSGQNVTSECELCEAASGTSLSIWTYPCDTRSTLHIAASWSDAAGESSTCRHHDHALILLGFIVFCLISSNQLTCTEGDFRSGRRVSTRSFDCFDCKSDFILPVVLLTRAVGGDVGLLWSVLTVWWFYFYWPNKFIVSVFWLLFLYEGWDHGEGRKRALGGTFMMPER